MLKNLKQTQETQETQETDNQTDEQAQTEPSMFRLIHEYSTLMKKIKKAIEKNPNALYQPSYFDYFPIHSAARQGHIEILKLMIKKDSSLIDQTDSSGMTPAIEAAMYGQTDTLSFLIKINPNVINQKDNAGDTPATIAARCGQTDTLSFLINSYPHLLNQANKNGETPAIIAAESNRINDLKLMISKNPKVLDQTNNEGDTPATIAAKSNSIDTLKLMIKINPKVLDQTNDYGHTPVTLTANAIIPGKNENRDIQNKMTDLLKFMIKINPSVINQEGISKYSQPAPISKPYTESVLHHLKMCPLNESTRNFIYAYRTPENADELFATLFCMYPDCDKADKDKEVPAFDNLHHLLIGYYELLEKFNLRHPPYTAITKQIAEILPRIETQIEDLNTSCNNEFSNLTTAYQFLKYIFVLYTEDPNNLLKAIGSSVTKNDFHPNKMPQPGDLDPPSLRYFALKKLSQTNKQNITEDSSTETKTNSPKPN